jgi:hypothetical protein
MSFDNIEKFTAEDARANVPVGNKAHAEFVTLKTKEAIEHIKHSSMRGNLGCRCYFDSDHKPSIQAVMKRLKRRGFEVSLKDPQSIFISWRLK